MKIGIVGTGYVTNTHLTALTQIEGVEIAAIAGRNEAKAGEYAAKFGGKVYAHWLPMLEGEKLDAVCILLPPHLHGDLERACAEHVPAVLIEKPISQSLETAHAANEAFKKAGTLVSVAYMNRYRTGVQKARSLFAGEDPSLIANGYWVSDMPPPMWWRTFEQSGGQFVEQCTHVVDAARFTMGDITEVSAYRTTGFMTAVEGYTVDDAMVVNAKFANGGLGTFATACFPKSGRFGAIGLDLTSRTCRVTLDGWDFDATVNTAESGSESIPRDKEDIFLTQAKAFVAAVASGDSSGILSSYEDGMKTLAVTLAANESAREKHGAPVKVAF